MKTLIILDVIIFIALCCTVIANFKFPDHSVMLGATKALKQYTECRKIRHGTVIHYDQPNKPFYWRHGKKIILEKCPQKQE